MQMTMFKHYREKSRVDDCCRLKYESSFIVNGTGSTTIHHIRTDTNRSAALVINDKEGPDSQIVFTDNLEDADLNLRKGDYFLWNKKHYFVYEDYDIVREVAYIKQKAYECNVDFEVSGTTLYGYYVSSLRQYVDTSLQQKLNISDNEKPIMVIPQFDELAVGLKIVVKGKPYKIIDFDLITNDGIAYISLDRDFNDKSEDVVEPVFETDVAAQVLKAGEIVTLPLNYGYFKCDVAAEVISRTAKEVQFKVPYGATTLTITTKDLNKIDVETIYKVV